MKTLKEIATIVLERRHRMNPTVMQGEMVSVLGEDGLQEALNRRWLVPNYDSGYLQVANHGSVVEEIEQIAAMPEPAPAPDTLGESRQVCQQHAIRGRATLMEASVLSEIAAPATGRPSPGFVQAASASTPTAPAAPVPPPAAQAGPATAGGQAPSAVGEDASVVQNGRTYQGKIASINNGKYRLSFGGPDRPQDRDYDPNEISRIASAGPVR